jgi:hypothetical protein
MPKTGLNMSFELSETILGCGLERGPRRQILEAIAHFADNETGLSRVSLSRLATRAALSERTIYRILPQLLDDPETDGLVRCVRAGGGRGHASVYKLDIARLEPVTQAIRTAGRKVYAGVSKALQDAGIAGEKASAENIRQIFRILDKLLRSEGEFVTAQTVCALAAEFEEALRKRKEISIIGRPLPAGEKAGAAVESAGLNPDSLSLNPDSLTIGYNKDLSPSGITTPAPADRAGCGWIYAAAATARGEFLFDAEGLLAHAALCRSDRLDLLHDLQGRLARVTRDGVLAIRCRSAGDAEAMQRRWLDALLGWATDAGLSGVVFDGEVRPPP